MKTASIADIKSHFSAYVKASEEGPVVVTRNGKPVAVLLGMSDEEELERFMMAHSPRLQEILEASRQQIERGEGIPHDEFWADLKSGDEKTKKKKKKKKVSHPSSSTPAVRR